MFFQSFEMLSPKPYYAMHQLKQTLFATALQQFPFPSS
jgi:hypothetical protein